MKAKDISLSAIALALIALLAYFWFSPAGLQPAPDISLKTIDGKTIQLSDLHGRPVLVNFWATTCPGCVKEMPHLVELYNKYSPQGFEVIGVAMYYDPPNQVVTLSKARNIPYTIALDIDGEAARAFDNVRLTPTSFLISPEGKIVQQKIGDLDIPQVEKLIESMLPSQGGSRVVG
jgi:peroxiredoxin